jgi:RNA polymerase sigma-70 factor (ECF subfamily)
MSLFGSPFVSTGDMMSSMAEAAGPASDLEGSFYRLYNRESGLVLRYFRAAVLDLGTAEDLTADTFCRAWDRWSRFGGTDELARAWVMRIARNRLIDHSRRNKKMAFVALDESSPGRADGEQGTVDRMALSAALASLKVDERDLLAMRLAGLSHAEIAKVQARSEEAVKKSWQRALLRLRPQLEDEQ